MTLSEVYFYMLIIIYVIFSVLIVFFSEDLKIRKYFIRFFKITFLIGWIGVVMQYFGWNYLCKRQLLLMTFSPCITLIIVKSIMKLFEFVFKKEPFFVSQGKEPIHGIWIKNEWNNKNFFYHFRYSTFIMASPIMTIAIIYGIIGRNFC